VNVLPHSLAALAAVLVTAASQLILKAGVDRSRGGLRGIFLNPLTACAYAMLVGVTLLNLYAFRVVPLKAATVLLPLTLLLVSAGSHWLLRERLTRDQALGALLILAGMAVFAL
jgi:drug/metabolite transporter (DMT)-like permease